jgi:hypothetical protein
VRVARRFFLGLRLKLSCRAEVVPVTATSAGGTSHLELSTARVDSFSGLWSFTESWAGFTLTAGTKVDSVQVKREGTRFLRAQCWQRFQDIGRAALKLGFKEKPGRLKSLKMFAFRPTVFRGVWYRECLSILWTKFRDEKDFEARISMKGDLTMYRKMFTGMICLMLLGFLVPNVRADQTDEKTIVTVNEAIQVPGKVLPTGTYVFKLLDPNDRTIVAIYNADQTHLIAIVRGIPDYHTKTPGKAILRLEERSAGQPEALKEWFYPGDNSGVEFVYPTQKG